MMSCLHYILPVSPHGDVIDDAIHVTIHFLCRLLYRHLPNIQLEQGTSLRVAHHPHRARGRSSPARKRTICTVWSIS